MLPDSDERLPRPAKPAPPPGPGDLQAARERIWVRFRSEYDKDSDSDRSVLGHKLLKLAVVPSTDDLSRFAMLREARDLAASAHDKKLALQAADATAFFFDVDPMIEKFQALSAGQWPDDSEQSARELIDDWLTLSDQAASAGRFDIAEVAATHGVRVAQHSGDEQAGAASSNQLTRIRLAREQQARLKQAIQTLSGKPDDPQANAIVGAHAASAGDWDKALPMLKKSDDTVLKLAATKDLESPKDAAGQIALGEAWTAAAQRQPTDVAEAFYGRARRWYKSALPLLAESDQKRIRDRLRNLPGGSIFEAIADSPDPPRHRPPLGGKGGHAFSQTVGGAAVLTGVRITVGPVYGNPCISSIQSTFRTASGRVEGTLVGKPQGNAMTIEAKNGYAVAGFVMKTGWAVDGFKVVFMRIKGESLDPTDRYESPWYGGRGGGDETTLGCDGKPVIGLEGRCGDGIDALGIVQIP